MPFYKKIETDNAWGGIWKMTESSEELKAMLPPSSSYLKESERLSANQKRLKEFLTARVLVLTLLPGSSQIIYLPSGKPRFADGKLNLSISHTRNYVAVLFSEIGEVGIDIETISERILKLKSRIVSVHESAVSALDLLLHWSAKETAFKILDVEGLDFTKNLRVENFNCSPVRETFDMDGVFTVNCSYEQKRISTNISVRFQVEPDFVLTFAVFPLETGL